MSLPERGGKEEKFCGYAFGFPFNTQEIKYPLKPLPKVGDIEMQKTYAMDHITHKYHQGVGK